MRIGIILTGDYGWAGGLYYSLNIINLLSSVSASKNIRVVVIVNAATPVELIDALPKVNVEVSYLDKKPLLYRLYHKLVNDRLVADINALKLDVVYPLISYHPSHKKLTCRPIYWLYDFQHKFLPELFSQQELDNRDLIFSDIATQAKEVVFSSYDSKNHFEQFYPHSAIIKHVYNFVSLVQKEVGDQITPILQQNYFIVCNQFWPHKNHVVVLKALSSLLKNGKHTHVVFTGKYNDERNKDYVDSLKKIIREEHLETHITLTGFISREEQVNLMLKARAIIQPSFFEGWSTVVEDAKALNKFLIASNIHVNKEQIKNNVSFFDPLNHDELSREMLRIIENKEILAPMDYGVNIENSKKELLKLFKI